MSERKNSKGAKKNDGICQKDLQQNLHNEDNFLKHTIIIYSQQQQQHNKKFENQNSHKYSQTFRQHKTIS